MAKKNCESEIQELREQIEKLMTQQSSREKSDKDPSGDDEAHTTESAAGGEFSQLREKLEEFADLLQQDLKQIPATTAVAIFALGVLMGRLMSR